MQQAEGSVSNHIKYVWSSHARLSVWTSWSH